MDLKVYKKETVSQPSGAEDIYVPSVIDIYPIIDSSSGKDILTGAEILSEIDGQREECIEQACSLATIWQRGLDPLDLEDGNRWSELYLNEINVIQIMEDLTASVESVSPSVTIEFDTVEGSDGQTYFSYKIKVVS